MEITWVKIAGPLAEVAIHTSVLSAVMGGTASLLRQWLPSEDLINGRVELAKEKLIAKVAECHRRVLDSQRRVMESGLAMDPTNPLDRPNASKVDVVTQLSAEVFRGILIYRRLEQCNFYIKRRVHFLLLSLFFGIGLAFIAICASELRPFVTLGSAVLIALQCLAVTQTRSTARAIEEYERNL